MVVVTKVTIGSGHVEWRISILIGCHDTLELRFHVSRGQNGRTRGVEIGFHRLEYPRKGEKMGFFRGHEIIGKRIGKNTSPASTCSLSSSNSPYLAHIMISGGSSIISPQKWGFSFSFFFEGEGGRGERKKKSHWVLSAIFML